MGEGQNCENPQMDTETLQRWSHFLFWATIILPILGAMAGVVRFYVDRAEKRQASERAAAEIGRVRSELETIRDYGEVAKLNFVGTTGIAGFGLTETTSISRALIPAVEIEGNKSRYRCDENSLKIFNEVVTRFPRFPFSHYALAFCLQQHGDERWREHAEAAMKILKLTTTVDGHHPNHDLALREIESALTR
jgi:hypothetical protein